MTGARQLASTMTEQALDVFIRTIAEDLRLRRYHTFDSRRSDPGFPDLVLAGPGGILFRELKRESEKPTPAQLAWLTDLSRAGADAGWWRPSDLLSGRIARELAAISGLHIAKVALEVPVPVKRITPARRKRNTSLVMEAATASMGPLWVEDADLYSAAVVCAKYSRGKTDLLDLLAMTGLRYEPVPLNPPKGCGGPAAVKPREAVK